MDIRSRLFSFGNAQALVLSALLCSVGVFILGLHRSLKATEASLRSDLKVVVLLQANVSDQDAAAWAQHLSSTDSEIESVSYVSRAEALQKAQENPALTKSLLLLRENPFPASAILHYRDAAWLNRAEPALALKSMPPVQAIRWDPAARKLFATMDAWRLRLVRIGAFALGAGILSLGIVSARAFLVMALIGFLPFVGHADSYTALLSRYTKQIHREEKQMKVLRARLDEKAREAGRWQKKSDDAKVAWSSSRAALEQTRQRVKHVHDERLKIGSLAKAAERTGAEAGLIARAARSQAAILARDLYVRSLIHDQGGPDAVEGSVPEFVIGPVTKLSASSEALADDARRQEVTLRTDELRWRSEEELRAQEADRFHQQQESQWLKWQGALRKTTALQDEISQIDQSAKALQVMLQELRDHRDETQALKENRPADDQALVALRGTLPWPAQGRVAQNFGRQYPDGSNQLVVSNGIKIDSGAGRPVRAVEQGKVLYASPFRNYGLLVIVQHPNRLTSVYAGLGETQVKEGQDLAPLDSVGKTGESGTFYFELRRDEEPINPLAYLAPSGNSNLSSPPLNLGGPASVVVAGRRTFR
jgi:septal ring factor EnvC (AmiA/AmiB activator)